MLKRGIKYVLNAPYTSFNNIGYYYWKCKKLNILPIAIWFDFRDLLYFHSVYYSYSVNKLPSYLHKFEGSRLRNSHFDKLSIISTITPRIPQNLDTDGQVLGIAKSFYYRAHLSWNRLPLDLRDIGAPSKFKVGLLKHLWEKVSEIIKVEYLADKF